MISSAAQDQGFDLERLGRVGARLHADIAAGRYDGAQLKVSRHGRLVLDAVHGYADRAAARAMRGDEAFVSFSIGKQFTNVLVLNRIERGDQVEFEILDTRTQFFRERPIVTVGHLGT